MSKETNETASESVSLSDKIRVSAAVVAGIGELGLLMVVNTGEASSKAILAAGAVVVLQGLPAMGRIDNYQRHNSGIW